MNIIRMSLAAAFAAAICIPAQAALPTPTIKKPAVKVTKPTVTKNEDGSVTITKGDVKVEKPEITMPEVKKPELKAPELKKPTITKPSVELQKPTIEADGESIKLKKPAIKVTKPGISL